MNKIDVREVAAEAQNRRSFVRKLGLAGVAAVALVAGAGAVAVSKRWAGRR